MSQITSLNTHGMKVKGDIGIWKISGKERKPFSFTLLIKPHEN